MYMGRQTRCGLDGSMWMDLIRVKWADGRNGAPVARAGSWLDS